jgi:hypothetical protein
VPEYARPLRGEFGRGIRVGVEQALRRFIAAEEDAEETSARLYRDLGRGEHRAGRSLDALQAAYRVGARVAWRRVSQLADSAGVPLKAQHDLAEAIFAYIDELAAESVEGYADAQAVEAGSIQRHREELLMLLIAEPPASASTLQEAATRARWRLPQWIAMIVVEGVHAARIARRLTGDVLYATDEALGRIAVPDPSRARPELEAAARRYRAAVGLGPTVPLADGGRSSRWATLALRQASQGTVVAAEAQLATLLIRASPDMATRLRERVLQPLRDESETSRERLETTLLAWLRHQGSQAAIAEELGVHPQTVRYRMRRLRELFGTSLEDPDKRFELELALRAT